MAISQHATRHRLSPASARKVANWLQRCDLLTNDHATEQLGQYKYGQNVLEELTCAGIAGSHAGHLSAGLPTPAFSKNVSRNNLYWCPFKLPPGKSICVASSRLSKKLDTYDSWFDAIRTMAARLNPSEYFFITGAGTTTDAFLRRIGQLFGFGVLEFRPFPKSLSPHWIQARQSDAETDSANNRQTPCYFGTFDEQETKRATKQEPESIDQILVQVASEVRLLSVRKNGNIIKATRRRLAQTAPDDTKLLVDARLTSNPLKDELMSHGATAWWLYQEQSNFQFSDDQAIHGRPTEKTNRPVYDAPILDASEVKSDQFLLHWTRRRVGPWPDQTHQEYLDDLIFRAGRRDHREISSLARILASRRILGTNQLTRSSQPVACFSNIPLKEIQNRKVFRSHLGRWDFQPFGIAIDRDRLLELGARPVVYGDESTWEQLNPNERVFFQMASTRSNDIDWREESEWRITGDLDLNLIDKNSAVVFVASETEAKRISPISRWPIAILNSR